MHVILVGGVIAKRSPFTPFVTMGAQIHITIATAASVAHSNALLRSHVLSPLDTPKATIVQLEWISLFLLVLLFISLLYRIPRRLPIPLIAHLSMRSKAELMGVMRHLQGEISTLSQTIEAKRLTEQVAINVHAPTTRNAIDARMQMSNGLGSLSASMANDIQVKSRLVRDDEPSAVSTAGVSDDDGSKPGTAQLSRANSRRRSLQRAVTMAAAAQAFMGATDSRTVRGRNVSQGDRDMQKIASALRSAHADQLSAQPQLQSQSQSQVDPSQFLSVDYTGTKSQKHRRTKSSAASSSLKRATAHQRTPTATDFFQQAQQIIQAQQEEARALELS